MKIKVLFGKPEHHPNKWKVFKRISEGENCFNAIIGYKNWYPTGNFSEKEKYECRLRWISICLGFIGLKIYY